MNRRRQSGNDTKGAQVARKMVVSLLAAGAIVGGTAPAVWAEPSPPTNGGNGAGMSGQCTGPQDDRPASCKSQGGPGDRP
jgi:hypothetical protein